MLCCRPPANLNPFLPVPLENLFPTLPPATNLPNFDLQYMDPPPTLLGQDSNQQAFGMVVIDGPPSAVTTLSKRDGSHIQFVDCDSTEKHDLKVYRARYLCMRDSEDSNCNNIHLGGARGTIVKLPEECGYATYGVVHDIRPADNTSIPNHLKMLAPADSAVYELEFSYDFSLAKRDDGDDIFIRIDYAHNEEYWNEIVAAPAVKKRSLNQTIDRRFFSSKTDIWKSCKYTHTLNSSSWRACVVISVSD